MGIFPNVTQGAGGQVDETGEKGSLIGEGRVSEKRENLEDRGEKGTKQGGGSRIVFASGGSKGNCGEEPQPPRESGLVPCPAGSLRQCTDLS